MYDIQVTFITLCPTFITLCPILTIIDIQFTLTTICLILTMLLKPINQWYFTYLSRLASMKTKLPTISPFVIDGNLSKKLLIPLWNVFCILSHLRWLCFTLYLSPFENNEKWNISLIPIRWCSPWGDAPPIFVPFILDFAFIVYFSSFDINEKEKKYLFSPLVNVPSFVSISSYFFIQIGFYCLLLCHNEQGCEAYWSSWCISSSSWYYLVLWFQEIFIVLSYH